MNTTSEPRSNIKPSSIWQSARIKSAKKHWNFQNKRDRSPIPDHGNVIKSRGKDESGKIHYQYGPYFGPMEDLKDFARKSGKQFLKMGAVTIKLSA